MIKHKWVFYLGIFLKQKLDHLLCMKYGCVCLFVSVCNMSIIFMYLQADPANDELSYKKIVKNIKINI